MPEGEDLRQWHALIGTDLVLIKRPTALLAKHDVNSIHLPLPKTLQVRVKARKVLGIGCELGRINRRQIWMRRRADSYPRTALSLVRRRSHGISRADGMCDDLEQCA